VIQTQDVNEVAEPNAALTEMEEECKQFMDEAMRCKTPGEMYEVIRKSPTLLDLAQRALLRMAKSDDKIERRRVAVVPLTPPEVLRELSREKDKGVRWRVAVNPSTPVDVLRVMAKDKDRGVRWSVAMNEASPIGLLKELLKDEDYRVVGSAKEGIEKRTRNKG